MPDDRDLSPCNFTNCLKHNFATHCWKPHHVPHLNHNLLPVPSYVTTILSYVTHLFASLFTLFLLLLKRASPELHTQRNTTQA